MKRITIFTFNLEIGGIEKHISTLSQMFHDEYEVEIISTFKGGDVPAFNIPDNVVIRYLINEKPNDVSVKKLWRDKRIFSILKEFIRRAWLKFLAFLRNKNAIQNIKTDIIITSHIHYSRLVGKFIKDDSVLLVSGDHNYHQGNNKYIESLLKSVEKFDCLVVASNELADFYRDKLVNTRVVCIPNALDEMSPYKSELNSKRLIAVGRFSPEKGFDDLIDVMMMVNEKDDRIKLTLIGDGFCSSTIKEKVKNLNLQDCIDIPGFKTQKELEQYYLNSSLYVMTSHTEAFGIVLIEALNYGLPLIAFDCASGPRNLINEKVGFLIANRDKMEMANEIVELLNGSKLINMQDDISDYVQRYSFKNVKKQWMQLLDELSSNSE